MNSAEDQGLSVILSSHLIADLERTCDYLIVLVSSKVMVAGPVDDLLAAHRRLSGPRGDPAGLPGGAQVVSTSSAGRQTTLVVRTPGPVPDPAWTVSEVSLEDLALAYMTQAAGDGRRSNDLEVQK
jgi:ABC-2 type transport system ATP-binding protein